MRTPAQAKPEMMGGVIPAGSRQARPRDRGQTALWLLREPLRRRTWAEFRYVIVSLPLAIAGFAFTVVTLVLGALSFGVLLALSSPGARGLAAVSRGLAGRLLGTRVAPPPPSRSRPGVAGWIRSGVTDAASWRARAYLVLKLPVAVAGYLVTGYTWVFAVSGLTYPLRWLIVFLVRMHLPSGVNAARPISGLTTRLIGPASLTERVRDLEQTRAHVVDDSAARLRRIERDLHDGAQAQMVAVAMKLGLAREDLGGTAGANAEAEARLQRALELIDTAHGMAKEAIIELRDLARGIHPPVLDHGLDTALATLAARSAVPVELVADLPERPSAAIETIAYFCAAELLANVAKHSGARHATVEVVHVPGLLRLRVSDDGAGGARAGRGSGLAGLAERLRTVDGRMQISSPPGGPTAVTIEMPSHA